jgi:hypothetical protein
MQDNLVNTRQRLEEVETWVKEVKVSKQKVVNKVQQGKEIAQQKCYLVKSNRQVQELREENQKLMQTQETQNDLSQKIMDSLKEDLSDAQSQHDEAVQAEAVVLFGTLADWCRNHTYVVWH